MNTQNKFPLLYQQQQPQQPQQSQQPQQYHTNTKTINSTLNDYVYGNGIKKHIDAYGKCTQFFSDPEFVNLKGVDIRNYDDNDDEQVLVFKKGIVTNKSLKEILNKKSSGTTASNLLASQFAQLTEGTTTPLSGAKLASELLNQLQKIGPVNDKKEQEVVDATREALEKYQATVSVENVKDTTVHEIAEKLATVEYTKKVEELKTKKQQRIDEIAKSLNESIDKQLADANTDSSNSSSGSGDSTNTSGSDATSASSTTNNTSATTTTDPAKSAPRKKRRNNDNISSSTSESSSDEIPNEIEKRRKKIQKKIRNHMKQHASATSENSTIFIYGNFSLRDQIAQFRSRHTQPSCIISRVNNSEVVIREINNSGMQQFSEIVYYPGNNETTIIGDNCRITFMPNECLLFICDSNFAVKVFKKEMIKKHLTELNC